MRIGIISYSDPLHAYLMTDPNNLSLASASIGVGTYSGLPLGERSWHNPTIEHISRHGSRIARIQLIDGACSVTVHYPDVAGALDPRAPSPPIRQIRESDIRHIEHAARVTLSKARMAILDFDRLPSGLVTVGSREIQSRVVGFRHLVRAAETGRSLGWQPSMQDGILVLRNGRNSVTIPGAARVILAGTREIKMPVIGLIDGEDIWVDRAALVSALSP